LAKCHCKNARGRGLARARGTCQQLADCCRAAQGVNVNLVSLNTILIYRTELKNKNTKKVVKIKNEIEKENKQ
jgi:hypothetical protein